MRAERIPVDRPVDLNLYVTAKEVVPTEAEADAEVARLSALNAGKGCTYFFQSAKLYLDGDGVPLGSPEAHLPIGSDP